MDSFGDVKGMLVYMYRPRIFLLGPNNKDLTLNKRWVV